MWSTAAKGIDESLARMALKRLAGAGLSGNRFMGVHCTRATANHRPPESCVGGGAQRRGPRHDPALLGAKTSKCYAGSMEDMKHCHPRERRMKRTGSLVLGVCLLASAAAGLAQRAPLVVRPENIAWSDIKDMPGWKQAVLAGDPTKPGPYVLRVKIPPNALVAPHSHPDTENITVIEGAFGIGEGATVDKKRATVLGVGCFYLLPAHAVHYAWAGPKGATLQIHGVGPSGMTMAGPAPK